MKNGFIHLILPVVASSLLVGALVAIVVVRTSIRAANSSANAVETKASDALNAQTGTADATDGTISKPETKQESGVTTGMPSSSTVSNDQMSEEYDNNDDGQDDYDDEDD